MLSSESSIPDLKIREQAQKRKFAGCEDRIRGSCAHDLWMPETWNLVYYETNALTNWALGISETRLLANVYFFAIFC